MSTYLLMNQDQEDLVALVHDFMSKKVDPYVAEWDRESHCPIEEVRELMDLGFWGIDVPEEYGGPGLSRVDVAALIEQMAIADAGFATTISASGLGMKPVLIAGSEALKQRACDLILEGGFGAFCLTEPGAGSDAGAGTVFSMSQVKPLMAARN